MENIVNEALSISEIPDGKHLLSIDDITIASQYYAVPEPGIVLPIVNGVVIPSIRVEITVRGIENKFIFWVASSGLDIGYLAEDLSTEQKPGFSQMVFKG